MLDGVGQKIGELSTELSELGDKLQDADSLSQILVGLFGTDDIVHIIVNYAGELIAQIIIRLPYDTLAGLFSRLAING